MITTTGRSKTTIRAYTNAHVAANYCLLVHGPLIGLPVPPNERLGAIDLEHVAEVRFAPERAEVVSLETSQNVIEQTRHKDSSCNN